MPVPCRSRTAATASCWVSREPAADTWPKRSAPLKDAAKAHNSGRKLTKAQPSWRCPLLRNAACVFVKRFDASSPEMELKYANNKLIGEGSQPQGPATIAASWREQYFVVASFSCVLFPP